MTETSTRTFGNEDALPHVPLPSVEDSAHRFLDWCPPLLDDAQRAETEKAVRELLAPDSPVWTLQADLERFDDAAGAHSWLDEFWPRRYLGRRDRIAVNANFFFQFHRPAPTSRPGPPSCASPPLGPQDPARRRVVPAAAQPRRAAVDGAEQAPVLHDPHPRRPAGLRPHPVHRRVAGPVHRAAHRRVLPRPDVPDGRHRPGRRPAHRGRDRGRAAERAAPRASERAPVDELGRLADHEGPRRVGRHPRARSAGPPTPSASISSSGRCSACAWTT